MKTLKKTFWLLFVCSFIASCDPNGDDAPKSSEKKILSFVFNGLVPQVTGSIDETTRVISLTVPYGTNIESLATVVVISEKAVVSPVSGTVQDFSGEVPYTVTAEDGTTCVYTVRVVVEDAGEAEILSGTMSSNRTLADRGNGIDYIIDGTFYVQGNALLTVEPGVKIAFTGVNGAMDIGENAGIKMIGTSTKPILFTGPVNNQNIGSWGYIDIRSNRADNKMEYVQFINGGSDDNWGVVNVLNGARLAFDHSIISGSANHGLFVDSDAQLSSFSGNLIEKCELYPLWIYDIGQVSQLDGTSSLENENTYPFVYIEDGSIETNLTIKKLTVPYLLHEVNVYKTLTVNAGVQCMFRSVGSHMDVRDEGKLVVEGTSADKVTFTRVTDGAFHWQGLSILTDNGSELNNCIIEYGGEEYSNLYIDYDAGVTLTNVEIKYSKNYGTWLFNESHVTASSVTFTDCANGNIYNESEDVVTTSF